MQRGEYRARRLAKKLYGELRPTGVRQLRCVVTGSVHPDLHHLDEAESKYWHINNVVPIEARLNKAIEHRQSWEHARELYPDTLSDTAIDHFHNTRLSHAYACNRLGAFICVPHNRGTFPHIGEDSDKGLALSANALINLRALSCVALAEDTLDRSVLHILKNDRLRHGVTETTKAMLATEIGSYFRDFAEPPEFALLGSALQWCDIAESLIRACTSKSADRIRVRLCQHRAIAYQRLGNVELQEYWWSISNEKKDVGYPEGTANEDMYAASRVIHGSSKDLAEGKHLLSKIYAAADTMTVAPWTLAHAYWLEADEKLYSHVSDAEEITMNGLRLFREYDIVPSRMVPQESLQKMQNKYPRDKELFFSPRRECQLERFGDLADEVLHWIQK